MRRLCSDSDISYLNYNSEVVDCITGKKNFPQHSKQSELFICIPVLNVSLNHHRIYEH